MVGMVSTILGGKMKAIPGGGRWGAVLGEEIIIPPQSFVLPPQVIELSGSRWENLTALFLYSRDQSIKRFGESVHTFVLEFLHGPV